MSDVRRAAYLLNVLLAVAAVLALCTRPAATARYTAHISLPDRAGAWLSEGEQPLPAGAREALASATVLHRTYLRSGGGDGTRSPLIDVTVIAGNDRAELHDPRSCLVGSGWRIGDDHVETLPGAGIPVRVCRLTRPAGSDGPGEPGYDALYFYVIDGGVVSQATRIRMEMLWSALVGRKDRTVTFLRFVQPIAVGGPAGASSTDLAPFAAAVWRSVAPQIRAQQ